MTEVALKMLLAAMLGGAIGYLIGIMRSGEL